MCFFEFRKNYDFNDNIQKILEYNGENMSFNYYFINNFNDYYQELI